MGRWAPVRYKTFDFVSFDFRLLDRVGAEKPPCPLFCLAEAPFVASLCFQRFLDNFSILICHSESQATRSCPLRFLPVQKNQDFVYLSPIKAAIFVEHLALH